MTPVWWVLVAVAVWCLWAACAVMLDAGIRRARRPSLAERLAPFVPVRRSLADEVEEWLRRR